VLRFEQAFGLREGEPLKSGERWRRHLVVGIKLLDDFARTGTITRFVVETTGLRIPAGMYKPLRDHEQYARERRHLRPSSLAERMHCIAVFLDFLGARGLDTLDRMQVADLGAFIESRSIWRPSTVSRAASHLRQFLQFLFMHDTLPRDFSVALPKARVMKQASIPSIWESELVAKLLGVVDRRSPKGKRDYAILLLAARLGMRLREHELDRTDRGHLPLFQNRHGERLSRSGVRYLLQCHVQAARSQLPGFTQKVSPHSLRHTKSMHLLQSGVSACRRWTR
jgi:site-specific recombinase XerD